jgi:hypothetical protein
VTDPTGGAASGANFDAALSNAAAPSGNGLTPQEQQMMINDAVQVMGLLLMNQAGQLLGNAFE